MLLLIQRRSRIYYRATEYDGADVYSRCIDNRVRFVALRCPDPNVDRRWIGETLKIALSRRSRALICTSLSRFNASFRGWNRVDFYSFLHLPFAYSCAVSRLTSFVAFRFLLFRAASHPRSHKRFYNLHPVRVKDQCLNATEYSTTAFENVVRK